MQYIYCTIILYRHSLVSIPKTWKLLESQWENMKISGMLKVCCGHGPQAGDH